MERSISMNKLVTVSKDSTTQRTRKSRNSLVLNSMPQVKPPLLETSTDSMSTISTPRDLNGMKSAANRLKTTIQLPQLLGNPMAQRLVLGPFAVQ